MRISRFTLINLTFGLLLLVLPFLVQLTASQGVYDPWCDQDADGDVDIFDIVPAASAYGTTGDPARNVTVTNWPKASDVPIWFQDSVANGAMIYSLHQNSGGYSTLHLNIRISYLAGGETATVYIIAPLYDDAHSSFYPNVAYEHTFTSADNEAVVAMDVPSEEFYFICEAAVGTTCEASLSYYLTWA